MIYPQHYIQENAESYGKKQPITAESLGYGRDKFGFKRQKNTAVLTEITDSNTKALWTNYLGGSLYVEEVIISALGDGVNNQSISLFEGGTAGLSTVSGGRKIFKGHIASSGVTKYRVPLRMTFSQLNNLIGKADGSGTFNINITVLGHEDV